MRAGACRIIDGHVHFIHPQRMEEMLALLDSVPCAGFNLVCLPNRTGEAENGAALAFKARCPERAYISAALDYRTAAPLDAQVRAFRERGFDGLKLIEGKPEVRKLLPLPLDGPAYAALWDLVERQSIPVVLHLGDPPEFWDGEQCPSWARDAGWDYSDGSYPTLAGLRVELNAVLARHPRLKLILAHFGFLSHDLTDAAGLLDSHPNLRFDLAPHMGMYDDFSRRPAEARDFFVAYSDRILYGTDIDTRVLERGPEGLRFMRFIPRLIRAMLEEPGPFTAETDRAYCGLGLPDDALRRIYSENFVALYGPHPVRLSEP
jgi:predicted TIM-barrel fold metal-dependent hydrolase